MRRDLRKCVSLNWAKTLRHKYLLIDEMAEEHYSSRAAYSWPDLWWFVSGGPELFNKGLKEPREEQVTVKGPNKEKNYTDYK